MVTPRFDHGSAVSNPRLRSRTRGFDDASRKSSNAQDALRALQIAVLQGAGVESGGEARETRE